MTRVAPPAVPRTRARASEPALRCGEPRVEDGRRCRRHAGAGTDHVGEGPCSNHDDGSWTRVPFAENLAAQQAFLEATSASPYEPTRALIEPLGYRRRDVQALEESDSEFKLRVEEARGQDVETIRAETYRRAIEKESDRLLELIYKTRTPEAAVLRQTHTRLDGQVDVRAVYADFSSLASDGISEERQRQLSECKTEFEVVRAVLGWVNPAADEVPRQGRPALELVSGGGA